MAKGFRRVSTFRLQRGLSAPVTNSPADRLVFAAETAIHNIKYQAYREAARRDAYNIPKAAFENDKRSEHGSWVRHLRSIMRRLPDMTEDEAAEAVQWMKAYCDLIPAGDPV